MRAPFASWGLELDDVAFAHAVAARMVELGRLTRADSAAPKWRWPSRGWAAIRAQWGKSSSSPRVLSEHWRPRPRLRIVVPDIEKLDERDLAFALEVMRWLGRTDPAPGSVVASIGRGGRRVRPFGWPIRVGIPRGFDAAGIASLMSHRNLISVEELGSAHRPWDVLLVPTTLRDAMSLLAAPTSRVLARCVVVMGSPDVSTEALGAMFAGVRSLGQAHAVLVANVVAGESDSARHRVSEKQRIARLLSRMAEELAHDHPIDRALMAAARGLDPEAGPIQVGDVEFLDRTRPSHHLRRLAETMVAAGNAGALSDPPPLLRFPGLETVATEMPGVATAAEVGTAIGHGIDRVDWGMESRGASGSVELTAAIAPALEAAAKQSAVRYLHSGARRVQGDEADSWAPALEAQGTYALYVWIGVLDPSALVLSDAAPVPFPPLENEEEAHELQVVLNEPRLLSEPITSTLLLPPVGESTRCRFLLYCRPGVDRIEGRVIVLHRGRVLQTGVVRGAILPFGVQADAETRLRFDLDAAPRRRLATLGNRSIFGAAIVANHGSDGAPEVVGITNDNRVARINVGDATLRSLTDRFNVAISDIAATPARFDGLRAVGTLELLRHLAQHGATLHRAINHGDVGPTLAAEPRVQIVSASVDGFLPLELAYRFPAPDDDAELCPGAESALQAVGDPAACAAACGAEPGGTERRLCPLGFWCLSKTIERHTYTKDALDEPSPFALYADPIGRLPRIPRPALGLVAASDRATAHDPEAVTRVVRAVAARFDAAKQAPDWNAWAAEVNGSHPGLLVALPHHARRAGASFFQIGSASELKNTTVRHRHVVGEPVPEPITSPIVLLLGCETQDAAIPLEDFPSAFRDHGAAIVIATIATILGRDAGPAAEALIALLAEESPAERGVGDLLLAVRRRLLLKGTAMGLALVGFGDADWRL